IALDSSFIGGRTVGWVGFRSGRSDFASGRNEKRSSGTEGGCVIVRAKGQFASQGGEVILCVVGKIVFAFGPLADIAIIARAHDRPPGDFTGAMAAVIIRTIRFAVVRQANVMAYLV